MCHTGEMNTARTESSPITGARARAHAEVRREILAAASRQLAVNGAQALSVRAVARELGMVSSAVYRYFPSRDDLLTALIVAAYDELGEVTEQAVAESRSAPPLDRWVAAAEAIRGWSIEHPHDYALLYGSPVPGYAAPLDTVDPGTRATRALLSIVRDAANGGTLEAAANTRPQALSPAAHSTGEVIRVELGVDIDDEVIVASVLAWTQLFGLLSFELFGQTKGLVEDHPAFFRDCATAMGVNIGLRGRDA
jgi:AcrR family transcriptional regulator